MLEQQQQPAAPALMPASPFAGAAVLDAHAAAAAEATASPPPAQAQPHLSSWSCASAGGPPLHVSRPGEQQAVALDPGAAGLPPRPLRPAAATRGVAKSGRSGRVHSTPAAASAQQPAAPAPGCPLPWPAPPPQQGSPTKARRRSKSGRRASVQQQSPDGITAAREAGAVAAGSSAAGTSAAADRQQEYAWRDKPAAGDAWVTGQEHPGGTALRRMSSFLRRRGTDSSQGNP